MITQIYTHQNELFKIIVDGRIVKYQDRKTVRPIQMIPKDPRVVRMIQLSRNKINPQIIKMFDLTKKEKEEYDSAQGDNVEELLAKICKKDCKSNGSVLQKETKK
jgi:hypothetical protein